MSEHGLGVPREEKEAAVEVRLVAKAVGVAT
jgi:hypothetical protein